MSRRGRKHDYFRAQCRAISKPTPAHFTLRSRRHVAVYNTSVVVSGATRPYLLFNGASRLARIQRMSQILAMRVGGLSADGATCNVHLWGKFEAVERAKAAVMSADIKARAERDEVQAVKAHERETYVNNVVDFYNVSLTGWLIGAMGEFVDTVRSESGAIITVRVREYESKPGRQRCAIAFSGVLANVETARTMLRDRACEWLQQPAGPDSRRSTESGASAASAPRLDRFRSDAIYDAAFDFLW